VFSDARLLFPSSAHHQEADVQKSDLLAAKRNSPSRPFVFCGQSTMSRTGRKGVVVSGCPACEKRINTMTQFLDHLANDVMPALIDRLVTNRKGPVGKGIGNRPIAS
jgi:hypothetical protein